MPLQVKVTADFPKLVQGTLTTICPCHSVTVDPVTGIVSLGPMLCSCYCDHPAGCNLLTDLVRDARSILIYHSAYSSSFESDGVWWYPEDLPSVDQDTCGKTVLPAWTQLAHELVHALLDQIPVSQDDEDDAVRGENQIRRELCVPMRKTYSGKVVSNFGKHILDANIRPEYNCNCSTSSVGIFRAVRRLQCALFSWFCIAKSKVAAWWSFLIYRKVPVPRPFNDSNLLPPERQIADALRVRTLVPMATAVDHSHPLLPDAEWEVTLESIGLVGMYRALVVAVRGDQVRMLTNFTLRPSGPPYLSAPGATLAASQGQSQSLADDIRARLSQLQFSEGGGGSTTAADGAVTFLTIRHGSQERKTALYFYHFPASANHWRRPDGVDGERWDAINTVYEIWRDVVSSPAVNPSPTSMPET